MRTLWVIPLLAILAGCGPNVPPPPRNLDDACAIAAERPKWMKAMLATQSKWGVPVAVQMATIYQESKFKGDARTPLSYTLDVIPMGRHSSAYGYSQAIDSTWDWYKKDQRRGSARRDNFDDAVDFMGWYMDQSEQKLGIAKTDARAHYLAYHDGHSGYRRGTYKRKSWLMRISAEVQTRAEVYSQQLVTCMSQG
jgi:hypothetical protein